MQCNDFYTCCRLLERNEATLEEVDLASMYEFDLDDDDALQFSQALANNTHVRTLTFCVERNLTVEGAEHLAQSIRSTNITSLEMRGSDELHVINAQVKRIFMTLIADRASSWTNLALYFLFGDEDVRELQLALLQNRNTSLPNFRFAMNPELSPDGARGLASILTNCNHVSLFNLTNVPANIMQIIYHNGIGASTTVVRDRSISMVSLAMMKKD
jgi:hypothetical protein